MLERSVERLHSLFGAETVVDLPRIRAALGNASAMTAFRYLRQVPYRRSYNHNGRFYCLYEPSCPDRFGLWSMGDVYFSVDGSLGQTVQRLVCDSPEGATHRELQERLHVRVHNTLLTLVHRGEIVREHLGPVYLYLHPDTQVRTQQLHRRQELICAAQTVEQEATISDEIVIRVLLTLLRHPEAKTADVVRFLRGHSPPISGQQVEAVFVRYDLDPIGKKGGGSIS